MLLNDESEKMSEVIDQLNGMLVYELNEILCETGNKLKKLILNSVSIGYGLGKKSESEEDVEYILKVCNAIITGPHDIRLDITKKGDE